MAQKKLNLETENLIFYPSTRIVLFTGKLKTALISNNQIFLETGTPCKVKAKSDILDFSKVTSSSTIEFLIDSSYEEKNYRGEKIKQFTAVQVEIYNANDQCKRVQFWVQN